MVLSDGRYSAPFSDAMTKDWVLRFKRARLLARERLCLLEAIMSEMNFLQSTQTSMAFQSSISSFGSSMSSWDEDDCRVCLDNLREMEKRWYCQNCEIISCNYVWFCQAFTLGWVFVLGHCALEAGSMVARAGLLWLVSGLVPFQCGRGRTQRVNG